jgi:hypothetical protein
VVGDVVEEVVEVDLTAVEVVIEEDLTVVVVLLEETAAEAASQEVVAEEVVEAEEATWR